jgi:ATP-dependent Lon protease
MSCKSASKTRRCPKKAKEKALAELGKLKLMSPMSAEATVVRSYIDWMVSVPWKKRSKVKHDLKRAAEILDEDHYGLERSRSASSSTSPCSSACAS